MLIEKNSKLVMIGDSVTDCRRAEPVGEGLFGAEGDGYVNYVSAIIKAFMPEERIRVVNMGHSGDTVRSLKARWQRDIIDLKPDWVSIMIGVNDVWRQYDIPLITEQHVYIEEYKETLEELIKETLPKVKGLILMTPYYMEPNRSDSMRATLDQYGAVVKELSEKYNTVFIDVQAAFDEILKTCHSSAIAWDRIHPNSAGQMVIARAVLNGIGMEWK